LDEKLRFYAVHNLGVINNRCKWLCLQCPSLPRGKYILGVLGNLEILGKNQIFQKQFLGTLMGTAEL